MKAIISMILVFAGFNSYTQVFKDVNFKTQPDTLMSNSIKYPVIITKVDDYTIWFYGYLDSSKNILKASIASVKIVSDNRNNRKYVELDESKLRGKQIFISVTPFKPFLSFNRWKAVIDSGLDNNTGILKSGDEHLIFKSELAIVNFLIGEGWELYQIREIDKGTVGFASGFLSSSAIGGSAKISTTSYIMRRVYWSFFY